MLILKSRNTVMYNLRMGSKGGIGDEAYAGKIRLKDREPLSMREQEGKKITFKIGEK